MKEQTFIYEGESKNGFFKKGIIYAHNKEKAEIILKTKQINITKIYKKPKELWAKKISNKEINLFVKDLAVLLKAEISIVRSLEIILGSIKNITFLIILNNIKNDLESGLSLAKSLALYPKYFNKVFINLVNVGQKSGNLVLVLEQIFIYRNKIEDLKKKLKKAMNYPIIVILVSLIVTWILMTFAIPSFAKIFKNANVQLPFITQITIDCANFLQNNWIYILIFIILLLIIISISFKKSIKFKTLLHFIILKIPIIKIIVVKSSLAKVIRTLEISLKSGINIKDAIEISAQASGNIIYENKVLNLNKNIANGMSIFNAMKQEKFFPNLMLQMILVGEESGQLNDMLNNLASIYEEDTDYIINNISVIIEPLIMLILGSIVGFLVISMYIPIFNLGNAF